jgi:hypothetical protein
MKKRTEWASLSIPQLQALYKKEIGRETDSHDRTYLIWKIGQARRGHVRVGPEVAREQKPPQAILSVRIDADAVEFLDAAWRKHGFRSRNHLFIDALQRWLDDYGEFDGSKRFAKMRDGE